MSASKSESTPGAASQWASEWLDGVKALARERGVHLLLLEDDKGDALVAASVKPFKVVC